MSSRPLLAVALTFVLMFSGLAGALMVPVRPVPVDGPLASVPTFGPMAHNSSDSGKYDALAYDLTVDLDLNNGEMQATAVMTLKAMENITQFNVSFLRNLEVTSLKDDLNNDLTFFHNKTHNKLLVNLTAQETAGTEMNITFGYQGNVTNSLGDDRVDWAGTHFEAGTPWYPLPLTLYTSTIKRPNELDRHDVTIHLTVPDNWTVVAMGDKVSEVVQGSTKIFTYSSIDETTGMTVAAAEYFSNSTAHGGVTLTTYQYQVNATRSGMFIEKAKELLDWAVANYGAFPYDHLDMVEVTEDYNTLGSDQAMMICDLFDNTNAPTTQMLEAIMDQYFLFNTFPIGPFDAWLGFALTEYALVYYQMTIEDKTTRLLSNKNAYVNAAGPGETSIKDVSTSQMIFDDIAIAKGSYVLHMLRYLVGDTVFKDIMKGYVTLSSGATVTIDTFMEAVGGQTATDLTWFWQQWLNTTDKIDFTVNDLFNDPTSFIYDDAGQLKVRVTINNLKTAAMPVDLAINLKSGTQDLHAKLLDKDSSTGTFDLNVSEDVTSIVVDPDMWLLDIKSDNDMGYPLKEDLVVTELTVFPEPGLTDGDSATLSATVRNDGANTFSAKVEFYDNGSLIDHASVTGLEVGEEETVQVTWTAVEGDRNISVMADADGDIMEFNETNNWANATVHVAEYIPPPDLYFDGDIEMERDVVTEGEYVHLNVSVYNDYKLVMSGVTVEFKMDGVYLDSETLVLQPFSNDSASAYWHASTGGLHTVRAIIHTPMGVTEADTTNNEKEAQFYINKIPTAVLEVDIDDPMSGEDVEFDGRSSLDDGTIVSYMFDFGDGTVTNWTTNTKVVHNYSIPNTYEARLKVKDDIGIESEWSEEVVVDVQNNQPVADFEVHPTSMEGNVNTAFKFTPLAYDPDGAIVTYFWDFGDTKTTAEESPIHKYDDDGEYTVRFAVTDNDGTSSEPVTKMIKVKNLPPIIAGTVNVAEAFVNDPVTLDAGATWDPDDSKSQLKYEWRAEGRTLSKKVKDTVTFSTPGSVTITLEVTDDDGATNKTTFSLTVKARPKENGDDGGGDNTMMYAAIGGAVVAVIVVLLALMLMRGRKKAPAEEPEEGAAAGKAVPKKVAKRPAKKKAVRKGKGKDEDEPVEEKEEEAAVVEEVEEVEEEETEGEEE